MKKILVSICVLLIFAVLISTVALYSRNINDSKTQSLYGLNKLPSKELGESLYQNLFITMIYPYVNKAIDDFYDEYMTYTPGEAPYSYKFLDIKKTPGLNYSYVVKLQVQPYIGPHLSVGLDNITLKIDLDKTTVEKFEHIKSYQLPPHYQGIMKKSLP
jgi:hypothetical protein